MKRIIRHIVLDLKNRKWRLNYLRRYQSRIKGGTFQFYKVLIGPYIQPLQSRFFVVAIICSKSPSSEIVVHKESFAGRKNSEKLCFELFACVNRACSICNDYLKKTEPQILLAIKLELQLCSQASPSCMYQRAYNIGNRIHFLVDYMMLLYHINIGGASVNNKSIGYVYGRDSCL